MKSIDYHEAYAKVALECLFPTKFYDLVMDDKPDLHNDKLGIGIEVTQSIDENRQKAQSLFSKLTDSLPLNYAKDVKKIEKAGGRVSDDNIALFCPPGKDSFDFIIQSIKDKISKIKGYKPFNTLYLYIFSEIYANQEMKKEALEKIYNLCRDIEQIKGIYVNVPGFIYVFDLENNKIDDTIVDLVNQQIIANLAEKISSESK